MMEAPLASVEYMCTISSTDAHISSRPPLFWKLNRYIQSALQFFHPALLGNVKYLSKKKSLGCLRSVGYPEAAETNIIPVVSKSPNQWILKHQKFLGLQELNGVRKPASCGLIPRKVLLVLAANADVCLIIHVYSVFPKKPLAFQGWYS